MHIRTLQRKGYTVKSSAAGYWVDGRCGYLVAGYYPSQAEAVIEASTLIVKATQNGARPVWFFE
uniref:hypothetical protein n=1 Tax=Pseudomonas fluorescens TaxID=294 RepID=UPI001F204B21|nr:hypothetical protein [Pseudomonas fluorescens]